MRKSENRYFYHILVFPGNVPGAIMLNVVWMEREFDAYKLFRSMYPYLQQFPSYSNCMCKKIAVFTYRSPHFISLETPLRLSRNMLHKWKDNFNACQTLRSMYLSIFNSFRVLRCLSQCVSPKFSIFTTFLFPLGTPLGQSR